jgi:hypothetical protein
LTKIIKPLVFFSSKNVSKGCTSFSFQPISPIDLVSQVVPVSGGKYIDSAGVSTVESESDEQFKNRTGTSKRIKIFLMIWVFIRILTVK